MLNPEFLGFWPGSAATRALTLTDSTLNYYHHFEKKEQSRMINTSVLKLLQEHHPKDKI